MMVKSIGLCRAASYRGDVRFILAFVDEADQMHAIQLTKAEAEHLASQLRLYLPTRK